jgi:hypothetical protein
MQSVPLKASVLIKAPPSLVWKKVGDFDTWKDWNPFIVLQNSKIGEVTPVQINWNGKMIKSRIKIGEISNEKMYWKLISNDYSFLKEFTECQVTSTSNNDETQVTCQTQFSGILGFIDQRISGKVIQNGLNNMLAELKKISELENNGTTRD